MTWTVEAIETRKETIKATPNSGETARVPWKQSITSFPQKEIPSNLLVYRVENNRIRSTLLELTATERIDFFSNQETQVVQDRLNNILLNYAQDVNGSGVANIYKVLKEKKVQTEPLVITSTGIVVNGNRRLAAMRALFQENPAEFNSFRKITCVVLPDDADEQEISEVETAYQTRCTVTQDYTWINEALMIERQMTEFGWTMDKVKKEWRLSEKKVKSKLAELVLVREYLDFREAPSQFDLALNDKQSFVTLADKNQTWINNGDSINLIYARKVMAWQIISYEAPGHNKYKFIQIIEGVTSGTLRRLRETSVIDDDLSEVITEHNDDVDNPFGSTSPDASITRTDIDRIIDADDKDDLIKKSEQARQEARLAGAENDRGNALKRTIVEALNTIQLANVQQSFPQTHGEVTHNSILISRYSLSILFELLSGDPELWLTVDEDVTSDFLSSLSDFLNFMKDNYPDVTY